MVVGKATRCDHGTDYWLSRTQLGDLRSRALRAFSYLDRAKEITEAFRASERDGSGSHLTAIETRLRAIHLNAVADWLKKEV